MKRRFSLSIPAYKGAGIALFRKGPKGYEILLGKRKNNPGKNKWSIPGGGYENYDKTFLKTAKREFQEELSLDFNSFHSDFIGECFISIPKFKWSTFIYETNSNISFGDKVIHEFSDLKFIPLVEIKHYKLDLFVKREIKCFIKRRNAING